MKKFPNIVQALLNLEKESERINILRHNKHYDYPEWVQLIYFQDHKFNTYEHILTGKADYFGITFRYEYQFTNHTSPFVYLNLN
jgi:hypothetical protein